VGAFSFRPQMRVHSGLLLDQFIVGAALHDLTRVQREDLVRIADGAEPVDVAIVMDAGSADGSIAIFPATGLPPSGVEWDGIWRC
jgi:hypothetical protein